METGHAVTIRAIILSSTLLLSLPLFAQGTSSGFSWTFGNR